MQEKFARANRALSIFMLFPRGDLRFLVLIFAGVH